MKKIKILYLIPSLGSGGTEKHLYQLVENLDKNRFEVFVVCLSDYSDSYVYDDYLKNIDIKVHYFSIYKKRNLFKLILFINKKRIDVLHSLSYAPIVYDVIFYLFSKAKKLITVRRNMQHHRGELLKLKWFERFRNYFTSLIIANSNEVGKFAINLEGFDKGKLKTIFNGIDLKTRYDEKGINRVKQKISYKDDDFIISNIANIKPVKRQKDLVRLIALLHDIKYKLILVGREDDGYGGIVRGLIKELKLENRVYILPYTKNIEDILNISTIMVMSSFAEGFPNSILEAYKYNVPVIATNVGGNKELVNDQTGFLVDSKSSSQFLDKIVYVLSNKSKFETITNNAFTHIQQYDWKIVGKKYLDLYHKLLE